MKLSAPIFILKQQAKVLARSERVQLNQALDRIANREGFVSWSLLASRWNREELGTALFDQLRPGNLVLLAGRPGQGKTLLGIGLVMESISRGNRSALFTLESTEADVARCFAILDRNLDDFRDQLLVDASDQICAAYIIDKLASAPPNTLVLIDYLQLLDQRRELPDLSDQVAALRRFAQARRLIIVCLSQIDRRYDSASKPCPDLGDVRMPNPMDLTLFDKACFLNRGQLVLRPVNPG